MTNRHDTHDNLETGNFRWMESRVVEHRRLALKTLKSCPLCDAINAIHNDECFMCGWHGTFDHDPATVEAGLNELLRLCPELEDAFIEGLPAENPLKSKIRMLWARVEDAWIRFKFRGSRRRNLNA